MKVMELKAHMDAAFANADARLAKVDARFDEVDTRFAKVDARFDEVDARFVKVDAQFAGVRTQFAEVRADIVATNQRIESEAITTRRHFDVVAEHLRSDIALLADAVVSISTTLERSLAGNQSEHRVLTSALDDHEVRVTALERRRR